MTRQRWLPMGRSAIPGARLALAIDPSLLLTFKGYGHRGMVVAQWDRPPPGCPNDYVARQRDFLRLVPETTR